MKTVLTVLKTILLAAVLVGIVVALILGREMDPIKHPDASLKSPFEILFQSKSETETHVAGTKEKLSTVVQEETLAEEDGQEKKDDGQAQAAQAEGLPDIDVGSWEFLLANASHSIEEYEPQLGDIEDAELDIRIIEPMMAFINDARNEGLSVLLSSGYRGYDEQSWLFENKIEQFDGDEEKAASIVARPGTSEHQTGLAADITDQYYEAKFPEELEKTDLYQWMSRHCQEYGFIVRYPKGKEDVTGIMYEPWHFRYVGIPAATYIMENGITLEEFLDLYK